MIALTFELDIVHYPTDEHQSYAAFFLLLDNFLQAGFFIFGQVKAESFICNLEGYAFIFVYQDEEFQLLFGVTLVRMDHKVGAYFIYCKDELVHFHLADIVPSKYLRYEGSYLA